MHPPPRVEQLIETHIFEARIRQFAIPLVLYLRNFGRSLVIEDLNLAVDDLLFADALHDIASTKIHLNGVAGGGDFMVQTLNFTEDGLQTVPLRLVLLAAFGFGDWVLEGSIICPKLKLFQRRTAREKLGSLSDLTRELGRILNHTSRTLPTSVF